MLSSWWGGLLGVGDGANEDVAGAANGRAPDTGTYMDGWMRRRLKVAGLHAQERVIVFDPVSAELVARRAR
ncbi:hypothetical protein D1Y84_07715 [Acidipila sp. EB88]|nr:hypothetical protein D1Y84_07715 [Acidipila sp. EB88]